LISRGCGKLRRSEAQTRVSSSAKRWGRGGRPVKRRRSTAAGERSLGLGRAGGGFEERGEEGFGVRLGELARARDGGARGQSGGGQDGERRQGQSAPSSFSRRHLADCTSPAPSPPGRLRREREPAQRVHLAQDGYIWSRELYIWRTSRQFGRGAERRAKLQGFWAGGGGQGRSLWPGGDLGRRGCGGSSTGRRRWPARSVRRPCGLIEAPEGPEGDRAGRGVGSIEWAVRSASGELPSLSGGRAPIPVDPDRRGRDGLAPRGGPEGAGPAETWTAGVLPSEPAPSCT